VDNIIELACDEEGLCYVLFDDIEAGALRIAARRSNDWEIETISEEMTRLSYPQFDIAIDRSRRIHVVYGGDEGLMAVSKKGDEFVIEPVGPPCSEDPVLMIDGFDTAHIIYKSDTGSALSPDGWEETSGPSKGAKRDGQRGTKDMYPTGMTGERMPPSPYSWRGGGLP
jgi:hypothetical protein